MEIIIKLEDAEKIDKQLIKLVMQLSLEEQNELYMFLIGARIAKKIHESKKDIA